MSKIKAIVFDWDGVIVDSMPMIARWIQETAISYGVQISADKILSTYFQPKEEFYKSIGIKVKDMAELNARHTSTLNKYSIDPKLFDDVVSTLKHLSDEGLTLGIASHQKTPDVQGDIDARGLRGFFAIENALGGEVKKEQKLLLLAKKFGITPSELLFVGDLPSDISAAKKAGVKSAAIARHESGKARLKAMKPDYFLDSLTNLLAIC